MRQEETLRRSISLPLLTLYGLGTTIGAGIFVLVGKVAGVSGLYAPLAFLTASVLAALSAFSFAELSSRYPESAGEAAYVREGLRSAVLAQLVGLLVVAAGLAASFAIIIGFSGYLSDFVPWPPVLSRVGVVVALGLLVCSGVTPSVAVAAVITVVEIAALISVIGAGADLVITRSGASAAAATLPVRDIWIGVMTGAILAFYAFIGFEDMVNVAEETRNPTRAVPYAIVITLVCTTILYLSVSLVAIHAVPISELAQSEAPLSLIFERASGLSGKLISAIAVFSVLNGALIQIIKGSRVIYGMSRRGMLPRWAGHVHPRTRTPVISVAICVAIVAVLSSTFAIEGLASATSLVALTIFAIVNFALLRIKVTNRPVSAPIFSVPSWVPALGILASAALIAFDLWRRVV